MINGATEIMFHFGDPMAHSRAAALLNARFAAAKVNAAIVPFRVPPEDLADAVNALRIARNGRGAVVTMPHKERVMPLLDDADADARLAGACNVIRRTPDGRLFGGMLDGEAMAAALADYGAPVRARRVFMAGAGGVAAGIAFAVARHGAASLSIYNRSRERASALAARVRANYPALDVTVADARAAGHDVIINATSLGMNASDPAPCDLTGIARGAAAAEVVIRDQPTRFLAEAAALGCITQPGIAMLDAQIALLADFMMPNAI